MDFVSNTSKRSGQMVHKIRQHLLTQLDTIPMNIPTSTSAAPSVPGGHHDLEQQQQQQQQQQQEQQQQLKQRQPLWSPFPLGQIPEDVWLTVLSFFRAGELSSIRRASRDFLHTADRHADVLWGRLNRCDFPSVAAPTGAAAQETNCLSPHQARIERQWLMQYVKNVMCRANDEAGNLRANHRLRESLDSFTWPIDWPRGNATTSGTIYSAISNTFGGGIDGSSSGSGGGNGVGVIGLLSDLVTVPDPRIARALSHKRRAALSTVIVDNDKVLFDFRRRGLYTGPVNFLPLSTLVVDNSTPLAPLLLPLLLPPPRRIGIVPAGTEDGNGREEVADLLPRAPERPAPAGFLGYAVRLLRLRPEHEPLRWTVLFALFRDLAVFDTTEQAEAVRARVPDRRLFYCALDHPGAQDEPCPPGGRSLPHISHWGFHGVLADSGLGGREGEMPGVRDRAGETVGDALERQERTACFARSSLAFLQYGDGV
ncbi:unnamed protein product [Ectocarpus sp. 12 AP-2014]